MRNLFLILISTLLINEYSFAGETLVWLGDTTQFEDPIGEICSAVSIASKDKGNLHFFVSLPTLGASTTEDFKALCPRYFYKTIKTTTFWEQSVEGFEYFLNSLNSNIDRINIFTFGHGNKLETVSPLGKGPGSEFGIDKITHLKRHFSKNTQIRYFSDSCYSGNVLNEVIINSKNSEANLCGLTSFYNQVNEGEKQTFSVIIKGYLTKNDLSHIRNESDSIFIRYANENNVRFRTGSTLSSENYAISWAIQKGYIINEDFNLKKESIKKLLHYSHSKVDAEHNYFFSLSIFNIDPILSAGASYLFQPHAENVLSQIKNRKVELEFSTMLSKAIYDDIGNNLKLIGFFAFQKSLLVRGTISLLLSKGTPEEIKIYTQLVNCENQDFFL